MSVTSSPANHAPVAGFSPRTFDLVLAAARCWIVIAPLVYLYDLWQQTADGLTNGLGRPFGDDFINYWSAAKLAVLGRVHAIYDMHAFNAFQESVVGAEVSYENPNAGIKFYHYSYPPVMILFTLPIAAIPYAPALFVWLATSWYAFYRTLRLVLPKGALLLALTMPAVFVNAAGGQNAYWSAALLGGGLYLLDRRPATAGILFGLLIYKPQLGILIPLALVAGRRWQAFASASLTVMVAVAASALAFGPDIWFDYLRNTALLRREFLDDGSGIFHRMVSVFFAMRTLGVSLDAAYVIQATVSVAVATVVAIAWYREAPMHLRYALMILGIPLMTPYMLDYDLVVCGFAIAWLAVYAESVPNQWRSVGAVAILTLVVPLASAPVGHGTGLSIGALLLIPAFVTAVLMLRGTVLQPHHAARADGT